MKDIMSEEVLCAALDNTSINQDEKVLENFNSTLVEEDILSNSLKDSLTGLQPENSSNQDISGNPQDHEDYEGIMTGSYGEISLNQELAGSKSTSQSDKSHGNISPSDITKDAKRKKEKKRPDSLVLTKNVETQDLEQLVHEQSYVLHAHKSQQTTDVRTTSAEASPSISSDEFALHSSSHGRTGSDTSGLSELQGTLTVDGDLVTFVAEDLHEKIKMSSPVSRWTDSSSFPGSRSSTPSLYKQAVQPHIHTIDPTVLNDLETHTKQVATCVDRMLENLSGTLQSISSRTVDCMETYESAVCKTCDAVDINIKAVYQLMAKCEELSNSMGPLYKIADDVKQMKKMLDQLEHAVEHKS